MNKKMFCTTLLYPSLDQLDIINWGEIDHPVEI